MLTTVRFRWRADSRFLVGELVARRPGPSRLDLCWLCPNMPQAVVSGRSPMTMRSAPSALHLGRGWLGATLGQVVTKRADAAQVRLALLVGDQAPGAGIRRPAAQ